MPAVALVAALAPPALMFYDQTGGYGLYAGIVNPLVWSSNQTSCVATGGSPGDAWGGALSAAARPARPKQPTARARATAGAPAAIIARVLQPGALVAVFMVPPFSFGMWRHRFGRFPHRDRC